jgi:hypothetical protein
VTVQCPHCGTPVDSGYRFCYACGNPLHAQAQGGGPQGRPQGRQGASSVAVAVGIIIAILFSLLAIILAGIVGLGFVRYKQSAAFAQPPAPAIPSDFLADEPEPEVAPEIAREVVPDPARAEEIAQAAAPGWVTRIESVYDDDRSVVVLVGPPESEFTDAFHYEWDEEVNDYALIGTTSLASPGG